MTAENRCETKRRRHPGAQIPPSLVRERQQSKPCSTKNQTDCVQLSLSEGREISTPPSTTLIHLTKCRSVNSNPTPPLSRTWLAAAAAVGGGRGQEDCGAEEPTPAVGTLCDRHHHQDRFPCGCRCDRSAAGDDKRSRVQAASETTTLAPPAFPAAYPLACKKKSAHPGKSKANGPSSRVSAAIELR